MLLHWPLLPLTPSAAFLPPILALLFLALILPVASRPGVSPFVAVKVAYAYVMQAVAILLMSASALTVLHSVLSRSPLSATVYLAFLLIFAAGGILFVMQERSLRLIDGVSKQMIGCLFFYTWKATGLLAAGAAGLTLLTGTVAGGGAVPAQWPAVATVCLFGIILSWYTRGQPVVPARPAVAATAAPRKRTTAKSPAASGKAKAK